MMHAPMKPKTFQADLGKLPAALQPLTKLPRWVVWRWEPHSSEQPLDQHALARNIWVRFVKWATPP